MKRQKEGIRAYLKARRQAMDPNDAAQASQAIVNSLMRTLDWGAITSLHTYLPLAAHHEVDTSPLLQAIWQDHPTVQTATWHSMKEPFRSVWIGPHGSMDEVPSGYAFDVIIVPTLGFTDTRFRLGFGQGFYDRFLARQANAQAVGVCYDFGHIAFQPERHDVPLGHIVTETYIV